jgi:hypothetical protein
MPTVLRIKGYRFFFFSNEGSELPHIHVEYGENYAKFWLEPVEIDKSVGFNASEINKLRKLVEENKNKLLEEWYGFFEGKKA